MKKKKQEKKKKVFRRQEIPHEKYDVTVCTAMEQAEESLTMQALKGELINKWVYCFDDKSGLTLWGYIACAEGAKKGRWKPEFGRPEFERVSETKVVMITKCINSKTKKIVYGTCTFDPNDRFGDRKADTISKRRGMDKQIPLQQQIAFKRYVLAELPEKVLQITKGDIKKAKEETMPEESAKSKVMRDIFHRIVGLGLDTSRMHAYLRKQYKTKHLKELPDVKLTEIKTRLAEYAKDKSLSLNLKETLKQLTAAEIKEWGD